MPNYAFFQDSNSLVNSKKMLVQYSLPYSILQKPSSTTWENVNIIPNINRDISVARINSDELFLIGGMSGDKWTNQNIYNTYNNFNKIYQVANNRTYKYNMRTNELTSLPDTPFFTSENDFEYNTYGGYDAKTIGNFMNEVVVGCYNNIVYICRGMCIKRMGSLNGTYTYRVYGNKNLYKLDLNISNPKWEIVNSNPSLLTPKHGEAFCQVDDKLFMFGGMNCQSFDTNTTAGSDWWTSNIGKLVDEDIYPENKSITAYVLYMKTGAIEQIFDVPSELSGMYNTACTVSGKVYIINRTYLYEFNPETYTYTKLALPSIADDKRMLIPVASNKLLSLGGSYTNNINQFYNIDNNTWIDANIDMQCMSGLSGNIFGKTVIKIGGVVTTGSSALCSNSISTYSLENTESNEQLPTVVKIPKGTYYHSNTSFGVGERFTVTKIPQLATQDLEIKVGEYDCKNYGDVVIYIQQGG